MYEGVEEVRPGVFINRKGKVVKPIVKKFNEKLRLSDLKFNNIHWKNLLTGGNYLNLAIIICLLIAAGAYRNDTATCFDIVENPCEYIDQYDCFGVNKENLLIGVQEVIKDDDYNYSWDEFGLDDRLDGLSV